MGNLEKQIDSNDTVIREYLLNRLDEEATDRIDEKIMTESGFLDEVLMIEQELLEDLVAGRLDEKEKVLAEQIYRSGPNREKLDFAFSLYKAAEKYSPNSSRKAPLLAELPARKPFIKRFGWPYLVPVGAAVVIVLLALFLFPFFGNRAVMEKELALINSGGANNAPVLRLPLDANSTRTTDLMPKIQLTTGDEIIRFELGLIGDTSDTYETIFLDDQGNDLFTVSNIRSQRRPDGAFVDVLVPARYLHGGDFQIDLQGRSPAGPTKAGSFTFRVIQ